jgi:hypothetical protein
MKKGQTENTYPASEEPLVQALIEVFFDPPVADDRTILHKNGKVTRNGYDMKVISSTEEVSITKKEQKEIKQQERKFKYKYKKEV